MYILINTQTSEIIGYFHNRASAVLMAGSMPLVRTKILRNPAYV